MGSLVGAERVEPIERELRSTSVDEWTESKATSSLQLSKGMRLTRMRRARANAGVVVPRCARGGEGFGGEVAGADRPGEVEQVQGGSGDFASSDTDDQDDDERELESRGGRGRSRAGDVVGRSPVSESPSIGSVRPFSACSSSTPSCLPPSALAPPTTSRSRRPASKRLSASFRLRDGNSPATALPVLRGERGGTGRFSRQPSTRCEEGSLSVARKEVEEVGESRCGSVDESGIL